MQLVRNSQPIVRFEARKGDETLGHMRQVVGPAKLRFKESQLWLFTEGNQCKRSLFLRYEILGAT